MDLCWEKSYSTWSPLLIWISSLNLSLWQSCQLASGHIKFTSMTLTYLIRWHSWCSGQVWVEHGFLGSFTKVWDLHIDTSRRRNANELICILVVLSQSGLLTMILSRLAGYLNGLKKRFFFDSILSMTTLDFLFSS